MLENKKVIQLSPVTDITRYKYDEAGNRIRKTIYRSNDSNPPPLPEETEDLPSGWSITKDEYYSRDASGKEIAVYQSYTLDYWNVWGTDNEGRIKSTGMKYFYLKDHLGSIRAVINQNNVLVEAQDYDPWGHIARTWDSTSADYKFTGKEHDKESTYDYFGARYYDSRVANWGSIDPLFEKHIQWSPYNYVLKNPIALIDPNGRQVVVIFGGYGISEGEEIKNYSENSSIGSDVLAAKLNSYFLSNKEAFPNAEIKEYYASETGSEIADAQDFVESHMKNFPNDKIIIYGYSMGGVDANELAKNLDWSQNIQLEITVDAFRPYPSLISRGLKIPPNVKFNYNYYIDEITSVTLAHGGENVAESDKTQVFNHLVLGETHKSIDKSLNNKQIIFNIIKEELWK